LTKRLRQESAPLVLLDQRALVALRHLARAILFQDERNVRVGRHRRAEGLEQLHVLARVGKVILAADHVRDLHGDVVDDVHEVEHRVAVERTITKSSSSTRSTRPRIGRR
jgi:hypothetical protein